jgi:23S rRNA pseudouridine1911/1915/1917 synthase
VERTVERYSEDQYLVTHSVGPGEDGMRLDRFLRMKYRKRSRSMIQDAIDRGVVQVTRKQSPHLSFGRMKASAQLLNGDEVLVVSDRKPEPPVDFNYRIIFEDEDLFIIDKPGNLPVHPAGRYFFNTLLVHLRTHGHQSPLKAEREYFLVHRIDRETSGILVLTKTREAAAALTKQFAERVTEKRYLAVVRGVPPEEFEVSSPLRRSKTSRVELKMEVAPESDTEALSAMTRFKRLEVAGNFSLVECFPKTGRQHQIRVHLDHVGHPIVGDKLYGMSEADAYRYFESKFLSAEAQARLILPRHALHAAGIRFLHPVTGLWLDYRTDLPADLRGFFESQKAANRVSV